MNLKRLQRGRNVWALGAIGVSALMLSLGAGCRSQAAKSASPAAAPLAARALPSDEAATEDMIRFLAARVRRDPDDFSAQNGLAANLLRRVRETNALDYLPLAMHAAKASLASVPESRNASGLSILAQAEFTSHEFRAARDHARRLVALDPNKSEFYGLLGDASQELGDYKAADAAFGRMWSLNRQSAGTQTRLARQAVLHGLPEVAQKEFFTALALTLNLQTPPREAVAWCRWQMGETAFSIGDYPSAEQRYRDALITFPGYFRALASLGRVRAARGDLPGAIACYEKAVAVVPDPAFVAALGDLYQLAGKSKAARAQYDLVEKIGHLSKVNGTLYNRQLALFYADHDLKAQAAYVDARREYQVRRDIYGADAVAWTALKAGKLDVAQQFMRAALRLGTRDAKLFYHAGMIARARNDQTAARAYLQRALSLNPHFDPLQAVIARKSLELAESVCSDSTAQRMTPSP